MSQNPWIISWLGETSWLHGLPSWALAGLGVVVIFLCIVLPCGFVLLYLERKISADFQARVGPNRAGPAGVFQAFADSLKLLQKERSLRWGWSEETWLAIHTMALYSTLASLPLGSLTLVIDSEMSVFLLFWAVLVVGFGSMLLGLAQRSVVGWFGGMRIAAQTLSGGFPALVAILTAGISAGSFRWSAFVGGQGAQPFQWAAFSSPFQFLAMVVFLIGGLVLLALPPMDAAIAAEDLRGGVTAHLSGRRLILFQFGRFYSFFLWAITTVTLFLGGWLLPFDLAETLRGANDARLLHVAEAVCLISKTLFLMLLVVWVARVNPKARVDQVTDFSWKVLSPLALVALIGEALWVGIGGLW